MRRSLFLFLLTWLGHQPSLPAQHIFAQKTLSTPKPLTVPDLKHTFSLGANEFAMLVQGKKKSWQLLRSSHFLYERWSVDIPAPNAWNRPQLIVKGDSAIVLVTEYNPSRKRLSIDLRIYDLNDGGEIVNDSYNLPMRTAEGQYPKIEFSPGRSKFVVYNYISDEDDDTVRSFQIFETGQPEALRVLKVNWPHTGSSSSSSAHISDNGDLFFALADAFTFKLRTAFWAAGAPAAEPKELESNFFFERPANAIGNLVILRAGPTTYYLGFTARIGRELAGIHVSALNVVLNTSLAANNMNILAGTIDSLYANSAVAFPRAASKQAQAPRRLQDFDLLKAWMGPGGQIILAIEQIAATSFFHGGPYTRNLGSAVKPAEDKYYRAGDLILLGFGPDTRSIWQSIISKEQYSKGSPSGLSFIAHKSGGNLLFLTSDNARKSRIYAIGMELEKGTFLRTTSLLPRSYELVKGGSVWLGDQTLLLCAAKPGNTAKRELFVLELQ